MWEDFVYQVEHKDTKKSNEMYYPQFTKVIIHHFMSNDLSIPRRNKVNWHYFRDDHMFTTIKLVSRHQNTQQFGALLPIELTNEDIRNSNAYKKYYAVAIGATPPKPKASVRKTRSSSDTTITPPTAATDEGAGSIPGVPDVPTDESEEEISWNLTDEEGDDKDDDEGNDGDDGKEERVDRLLALEALAACLPFSEVVSLGPATAVGGVIVVSELLLVFQILALGLGCVAHVATT
nr:hypothetical protein [Tanacetum cinerariifolium]